MDCHREWCSGHPVILKLRILERRYNLESVQAWNIWEASSENKDDLQRRAAERIEGKGS